LGCRLDQDVGQAIAVAVGRDATCQGEDVGDTVLGEHPVLRQGAHPSRAIGDTQILRESPHWRREFSAADVHELPIQVLDACERAQQIIDSFLLDQAAD
jgi:hypothetical protein